MNNIVGYIVVVSILGICFQNSVAQEITEESKGMFATREQYQTVRPGQGNILTVKSAVSLGGKLMITTTTEDQAKMSFVKKAQTPRRSRAIDYLDQIAVNLDRTPTGLKLEMRAPNPAPWRSGESGLVEVVLELPEMFSVEVDAVYFNITADGPFRSFESINSLGRIDVAHVSSLLKVETANQRVTVTDISGEIEVSTTNAILTAEGISNLIKPLKLRNDGGDIRVFGLKGGANIKNAYGRIEIIDWNPGDEKSYIRCKSGPILVSLTELTRGEILINNKYEDIELTLPREFSAVLSLSVDSGSKIEADHFAFTTQLVEPDRLNLVVGDGGGLISGSIRGKGNILITGAD